MLLSVSVTLRAQVVVDAVREDLPLLECADELMEGLSPVNDGRKTRVRGCEDDVVDGSQVLVGVPVEGEQVLEGEAFAIIEAVEGLSVVDQDLCDGGVAGGVVLDGAQ